MTELQDLLVSYKKLPPNSANGNGTPTHAAPPLTQANEQRLAWQRLIDEKLIEWGRHPEQFEDEDGYKAPTPDNLIRATEFIAFCRDHDMAPPSRMAPDGEGGIVFEWYDGLNSRYVEIHPDGGMEYLAFNNCKLIVRVSI